MNYTVKTEWQICFYFSTKNQIFFQQNVRLTSVAVVHMRLPEMRDFLREFRGWFALQDNIYFWRNLLCEGDIWVREMQESLRDIKLSCLVTKSLTFPVVVTNQFYPVNKNIIGSISFPIPKYVQYKGNVKLKKLLSWN